VGRRAKLPIITSDEGLGSYPLYSSTTVGAATSEIIFERPIPLLLTVTDVDMPGRLQTE